MPRIRQYAQQYADEDFRKAVFHGLVNQGLRHEKDLADLSGIPTATVNRKMKDPSSFTVSQLRLVITAAGLEPADVLRFLGYTTKQIKKMEESA
ncbi:MAG: hypothetical protein IJ960_06895 [Oscillospiraceae bacterium]|nr:hypothetical protein [Oscillospiraceae bacterium]